MKTAYKCKQCSEVKHIAEFEKIKAKHSTVCRSCTRKAVSPEADATAAYEVYVPTTEIGYFVRNDGLKHILSRGLI